MGTDGEYMVFSRLFDLSGKRLRIKRPENVSAETLAEAEKAANAAVRRLRENGLA